MKTLLSSTNGTKNDEKRGLRAARLALLLAPLAAMSVQGCAVEGGEEDAADVDESSDALAVGEGTYRFQVVDSGKCVDVTGFDKRAGAHIQQWACTENGNQKWNLRHVGGDFYEATSVDSGKCLEVGGWSKDNGGIVQQWDCTHLANQQWHAEPMGGGAFRFRNKDSGKCMEVGGWKKNDGAGINQYNCSGGGNQSFRLQGSGGNNGGGGGGVLGGAMYVDPNTQAANAERTLRSQGNTRDADLIHKIASNPAGTWIGEWSGDVRSAVSNAVQASGNQLRVLVAYNMYQRDCKGGFSSGGAKSPDEYRRWIDAFAAGIGGAKVAVILEPDAAAMACNDVNFGLLSYAVGAIKRQPNAHVYVDIGNPHWLAPGDAANQLRRSGIDKADGFSINVSNYVGLDESKNYGHAISDGVGGKGFIIDTSRNGRGSLGNEWCNPGGRGLGVRPTANTSDPRIHAFLWVKAPGESDGTCNGGPAAGAWFQGIALELARNAVF